MCVIAAPTGTGKTTAGAAFVAEQGSTCWLADRHEDVAATAGAIESFGRTVGRVLSLTGRQDDGTPNCLHPEHILAWQSKGYNYRLGYCRSEKCCTRQADPNLCPFLKSLDALEEESVIVVTKALARGPGFFSRMGNARRENVVLDEDVIGLLRPAVAVSRDDLDRYLKVIGEIVTVFEAAAVDAPQTAVPALAEARLSRRIAQWCWDQIGRQQPGAQPEAVKVPAGLRPSKAVLPQTKRNRKAGRKALSAALHRRMRRDPQGMVRNVARDLFELIGRAVAGTAFVTSAGLLFHVAVNIPRHRKVFVLDATANPELLKPLFRRPVDVVCDERVQPAGRVIQFMDFNGPRSYLNKLPAKLVKIINGLGDLHPEGTIVLISHKSCVEDLAKKSRHAGRIRTAYFGALRGRNDLEPGPENRIACHIVAGSPKTTEEDRRQLALAVYGEAVLPFPELVTVRKAVVGRVPAELTEGDDIQEQVWEVRIKGYAEPRMQSVYDHTVTAELTHAADRARVLIHPGAVVYLLTNEPCPKLWFAEMCYADDLLDLTAAPQARTEAAYRNYEAKVRELLDAGHKVGNAEVCRALERKPGWGKRYWQLFLRTYRDALEGERKVRWKHG